MSVQTELTDKLTDLKKLVGELTVKIERILQFADDEEADEIVCVDDKTTLADLIYQIEDLQTQIADLERWFGFGECSDEYVYDEVVAE
jgi:inorganic pyrophosphatase